jgi:hypothetical protein
VGRFAGINGKARTLAVIEAMTHAIKAEFRYEVRQEEGTRTAAETIALGSGACRDFAVLMMDALRSFGVATRFVTGYLYLTRRERRGAVAARMPGAMSICGSRMGGIRSDQRLGCRLQPRQCRRRMVGDTGGAGIGGIRRCL